MAAQWVRAVSFIVALAASVIFMLFPFLLRHVPPNRVHAALPIVLFGLAGAFVHGVGYSPRQQTVANPVRPALCVAFDCRRRICAFRLTMSRNYHLVMQCHKVMTPETYIAGGRNLMGRGESRWDN